MNARSGGSATSATADFGNCNAVIMRCAQPKCGNGGCTDMSVTAAIVSGCVQSNAACKQYGDDLVEYISAQLVASSTAKANAAANAANTAAANAAAQQNAQQMAAMQQQMQQMQMEMAQQNAQTVAQLQNALNEQKQLTADAIASVNAARENTPVVQPVTTMDTSRDLTDSQIIAAQNGVSADVLAREQISGQILSSIENAETQLKALKATMTDVFDYAGCDSRGNNCRGPKRVKMFKQKAEQFFDPYENVLDEMYDALVLAQSVGVDITDIYMMLNGSCNVWGQYLCSMGADSKQQQVCENVTKVTDKDGTITTQQCHYVTTTKLPTYEYYNCPNGMSVSGGNARGGHECVIGQIIPPEDDISCTLQKTIVDNKDDPVQRDWLWAESSDSGANIRVGCASSALETSKLFRGRKKQASIDIETLQRIIAQDAPQVIGGAFGNKSSSPADGAKYCAIVSDTEYTELQKAAETKTLPKKVCVNKLDYVANNGTSSFVSNSAGATSGGLTAPDFTNSYRTFCDEYGGKWDFSTKKCNCVGTDNFPKCMQMTGQSLDIQNTSNSSSNTSNNTGIKINTEKKQESIFNVNLNTTLSNHDTKPSLGNFSLTKPGQQ